MRSFDYIKTPEQLLKPEIVHMVGRDRKSVV